MSATTSAATPEPSSLLSLLNVLLRHRRLLVAVPAVSFTLTLTLTILAGRRYAAESRFTPDAGDRRGSELAGLAAQFGIGPGTTQQGDPIAFYAELAKSRDLLTQLARSAFRIASGASPGQRREAALFELYGRADGSDEQRLAATVARLASDIAVQTNVRAGIVALTVTSERPDLAVQINRSLLELLGNFNLSRRRSQAAAEREFVEGRLRDTRQELEDAETSLRRFLEQNRRYQDSPQLTFEAARLQRRVDLRQQVFVSLSQAFERARMEEVRNTPVITVIDAPEGSVHGATGLTRRSVIAVVLGVLVAVVLALTKDYLGRLRAEGAPVALEFDTLRSALVPTSTLNRLGVRIGLRFRRR